MSDSSGFIVDPHGIDREKLDWVMELKNVKRGRIKEYADEFGAEYHEGAGVWKVGGDVALPSATQNELDARGRQGSRLQRLHRGQRRREHALHPGGVDYFVKNKMLYGPGKAANAGGVAVSGLEMAQNSQRMSWSREEVDGHLHRIMVDIHENCFHTTEKYGTPGNYVNGANIAGFLKVADTMLDQGLI